MFLIPIPVPSTEVPSIVFLKSYCFPKIIKLIESQLYVIHADLAGTVLAARAHSVFLYVFPRFFRMTTVTSATTRLGTTRVYVLTGNHFIDRGVRNDTQTVAKRGSCRQCLYRLTIILHINVWRVVSICVCKVNLK